MDDIKLKPDYQFIRSKPEYLKLIDSGLFWEFYPELTGNWNIDKIKILKK